MHLTQSTCVDLNQIEKENRQALTKNQIAYIWRMSFERRLCIELCLNKKRANSKNFLYSYSENTSYRRIDRDPTLFQNIFRLKFTQNLNTN